MYINVDIGFHILYDFAAKLGETWTIRSPLSFALDTSIIVVDSIELK